MQVGRQRDPRPALRRRAVAGRDDEAGEADELVVELLVEVGAGASDRRGRLECARDVGAVGVVLGLLDRPSWREQDDERDTDRQRRRRGRRDGVAEAWSRARADGEGDQQSERERGEHGDADQRSQVTRDRVRRLGPYRGDVERLVVRHPLERAAVHAADVDPEPDRQPDRLEPRAPVDERHVEVQRAPVAGGDGELDRARVEGAVLAEGHEREAAAGEGRGDHGQDDRGVAGGAH